MMHGFFLPACSSLSNPENGNVDQTAGLTYGQTAVYSCNTGFELFGSDRVTCLESGQWSSSPPVCQITGYISIFCTTT